jgi:flagellar assembly protein FliH
LQKPDGFRSLAELLREPRERPRAAAEVEPPEDSDEQGDVQAAASRELRLFLARVAEALESSVEMLRNDIAAEVVGRELQLAPADLRTIVNRAIRRYASEVPVRVRVHPDDRDKLDGEFCTIADAQLRPGDAVLEVRGGAIDASLGVRLESVLRAIP